MPLALYVTFSREPGLPLGFITEVFFPSALTVKEFIKNTPVLLDTDLLVIPVGKAPPIPQ